MNRFYRLGLIGYPLGHSRSPALHQGFLAACGLQGEYRLYEVAPDADLRPLLTDLRLHRLHGLNVTIPHKQRVLPLLDRLTPTAQAIAAVNTLWADEKGLLWGDNTDAPGFYHDLVACFGAWARRPRHALILGAGGAARAVVFALLRAGWQVTISARRAEQAQALARHLSGTGTTAPAVLPWEARGQTTAALIVNATPLGMAPHTETTPWPPDTPFPPLAHVYDLVYNPPETHLLRQAREAGVPAANGWGMLVAQAALAFRRWTGCTPPEPSLQDRAPCVI